MFMYGIRARRIMRMQVFMYGKELARRRMKDTIRNILEARRRLATAPGSQAAHRARRLANA